MCAYESYVHLLRTINYHCDDSVFISTYVEHGIFFWYIVSSFECLF